jgi:Ala-tRNA(Pro) deacylase
MTLVTDHLERRGVRFVVLPHRPVETSLAEARALGLPPRHVAKVVVLAIDTGPALAILPADARLDLASAAAALETDWIGLADEAEIARDFPEFELGAIPPLASLLHVPVVMDLAVAARPAITFPAGNRHESIATAPSVVATGGPVVTAAITAPR